jgi:hypothetical protein
MNSLKQCVRGSLFNLAAVLLLFAGVVPLTVAQNDAQYRQVKAADYAKWRAVLQSNVSSGSASIVVAPCYFTPNSPGGTFMPFTINTPITIGGTNPETVTPTAVGTPTQVSGVRGGCQVAITATLSNAHSAGVNVTTGDGGITEAAAAVKKGVVVIDGQSGSDTAITSLPIANAFVTLRDDHGANAPQYYRVAPSTLTLISAGSAPTNVVGTGGLSSGAYITSYECVDVLGGISLPATDSSQTATTTQVTESGNNCGTGSVGWIPMITAAAGSNGTEIEVPVSSAVCAVVTVETVKPACQLSSSALINANPSSTAKEVAFGTAHTTFAWLPSGSSPLESPLGPFQTFYGPFAAVSSISSSANADVAQFYVPAGMFNTLGKSVDVCAKVTGTITSTGIPTWTLKASPQYLQSQVTLSTLVIPTQTGAVTTNLCFTLQTTTTGTSGKFMTAGFAQEAIQSSGVTVTATDVSAAATSAIDLSQGLYFSLNLAMGTAGVSSVTVNDVRIKADSGN